VAWWATVDDLFSDQENEVEASRSRLLQVTMEENNQLRRSVQLLEAQCKLLARHMGLEDQLKEMAGI